MIDPTGIRGFRVGQAARPDRPAVVRSGGSRQNYLDLAYSGSLGELGALLHPNWSWAASLRLALGFRTYQFLLAGCGKVPALLQQGLFLCRYVAIRWRIALMALSCDPLSIALTAATSAAAPAMACRCPDREG
jgi:hypothetical protein